MNAKVYLNSGKNFEITNMDISKQEFLEMVSENKINNMVKQNIAFVSAHIELIEFTKC